jgi:hypothetical protein
MLTDKELIDGLRGELASLLPPPDLIDQLRAQAPAPHRHERRRLSRARGLAHRLRRPISLLPLTISILVAVGITVGALALLHHRRPTQPAQRTQPPRATLTLTGDGLGGISFGASPQRLWTLLDPLLGSPTRYPADVSCGVDSELGWPILLNPRTGRLERSEELTLTFDHGRFVGYQYGGGALTQPGESDRLRPRAATARGLEVGDSLATGRRLYGRAFQISGAQGGSWHADRHSQRVHVQHLQTPHHQPKQPRRLDRRRRRRLPRDVPLRQQRRQ